MRWFALAEKSKWDSKYGLTKEDAIARWFTGKTPKVIQTRRPSEIERINIREPATSHPIEYSSLK